LASPGGQDPHDGIFCRGAASGHEALALFVEHGFDAITLGLGCLWLCVVAAARTFVLGTIVLPAVTAVACAFVFALGPFAFITADSAAHAFGPTAVQLAGHGGQTPHDGVV
jgi:hypothetical protein